MIIKTLQGSLNFATFAESQFLFPGNNVTAVVHPNFNPRLVERSIVSYILQHEDWTIALLATRKAAKFLKYTGGKRYIFNTAFLNAVNYFKIFFKCSENFASITDIKNERRRETQK